VTEAKPPNVTGWLLEEAKEKLLAAGWAVESINLSLAPQGVYEEDGFLRVARQRIVGDGRVALAVVRECRVRV
jgi:hypothetical protein